MRIVIVGPGVVGGYFGGCLARVGRDVARLGREASVAAIRSRGLRLQAQGGAVETISIEAAAQARRLGPADVVIFAVKTWQLEEAVRSAEALFNSDTMALPLLNGVEATDLLAEGLGAKRVVGGLCRVVAWKESAGHIGYLGDEGVIECGEMAGGSSDRIEALLRVMVCPGVSCVAVDDIRRALWEKLAFIASVGSVGAFFESPLGQVRRSELRRRLLRGAVEERSKRCARWRELRA